MARPKVYSIRLTDKDVKRIYPYAALVCQMGFIPHLTQRTPIERSESMCLPECFFI